MSFWPNFAAGLDGSAPGALGDAPAVVADLAPPQSNLAMLYENRADLDGVVLSGGSWQPGSLGLTNLQTPYLSEVARSLSTDPDDTQFLCALPRPCSIGGIALGPTNLTPTSLVRIRSYTDPGLTNLVDDSGYLALPSNVVPSLTLEWEDPGFWAGASQEFDDIGKSIGKGPSFVYIPDASFVATYVQVEMYDQSNPDGYLDISRIMIGRAWRPTYNYEENGNSLDFEAITDTEEGRSGTSFFNARAMRRSFKFGFSFLPAAEYREIYEIIVRSGIHNQVFVVPNPADPSTHLREAFFGTLAQPPSLRRMSTPNIATEFVVKESL